MSGEPGSTNLCYKLILTAETVVLEIKCFDSRKGRAVTTIGTNAIRPEVTQQLRAVGALKQPS